MVAGMAVGEPGPVMDTRPDPYSDVSKWAAIDADRETARDYHRLVCVRLRGNGRLRPAGTDGPAPLRTPLEWCLKRRVGYQPVSRNDASYRQSKSQDSPSVSA